MKSTTSKHATYVALLRGINVGGANMISMAKLKTCFEQLGYTDVQSYINSGNIIFKSDEADEKKIVKDIEACIKKNFKLDLRVVIRSQKEIAAVCKKIPKKWVNNAEHKTDVMFLWKEVDSPKVLKEIVTNPAVDEIIYTTGTIIWHVNRKDYNKSWLHKFIGTRVYKNMTARNANTARKLLEMMKD